MQSIVSNKVSSLEVYSNTNKPAHVAADSAKVSGANKDSKILREIFDISMDNTLDLHSKVERLSGLLSAQGYDIDSKSPGTKSINKALDEIANLHSNISAKNKKSLVGKDELSHLHNEISKKLDIIKSSIRDNSIDTQHQMAKSKSAFPPPPVSKDTNNLTTGTSYADLWAVIASAIGDIKTNYLDYYSGLLQKYETMYEDYNNNVQKASSTAVTKGSDSNSVTFDTGVMAEGYKAFNSAVSGISIDPVPGWNVMKSDQKTSTRESLSPAFNVSDSGVVTFNLEQYNKLEGGAELNSNLSEDVLSKLNFSDALWNELHQFNLDPMPSQSSTPVELKTALEKAMVKLQDLTHISIYSSGNAVKALADATTMLNKLKTMFNFDNATTSSAYPAGIEDKNVSTPSYQAWLATFNASGSTLQSNMNSFTQRYSQANSTFDNLNKVLSGTISSLSDAAKDVFKSL